MIRIRRIYSSELPHDSDAIAQVREIFRQNFGAVASYADKIASLLDKPFTFGHKTVMLVGETSPTKVSGFSLIMHFPELQSSLLDFVAVGTDAQGAGLGSALYEATREHCQAVKSRGLYMEVLPDDPAMVPDPAILAENQARLKFYEHYGVFPIIGTKYETPVGKSICAPYLCFDGLGRTEPLGRYEASQAIRCIIERKYSHLVDEAYTKMVLDSVVDDPIRFRPPRYVKRTVVSKPVKPGRLQRPFAVVQSHDHVIHHVRERGYVERPARVDIIETAVRELDSFEVVKPRHQGEGAILAVHDRDFVEYLKTVCAKLKPAKPVYPYVFPIRRPDRRPKELTVRAGYYCIDTFTPLDGNAYKAARAAVDVAVTGALEVMAGRPLVYALCRPPGHHAERRVFGGFCYFNNAAIAAHIFSNEGRVAVLDIDHHHGNGTQDIFYRRNDVLTISIHGHPNEAYPYFSGFADERGEGPGEGWNKNFPLPPGTKEKAYLDTFDKAVRAIEAAHATKLVVSLGFDIMRGDPTGDFLLKAGTLEVMGRRLAALGLPTLVVQEGGYNLRNLKRGVQAFFKGFAEGHADTYAS